MSVSPIWLIALGLIVAIVPLLLTLGSCYLKVSIALGMLRSALGAQQLPGNVIILSMSLALSIYIMSPVFWACAERIDQAALSTLIKSPSLQALSKLEPAFEPWREFLTKHAGKRELLALQQLDQGRAEIKAQYAVSSDQGKAPQTRILLAAFVISELKQAFALGLILLLPFLVIDLIVANILAALGMFMLSPMVIALPLKILFFVLCDGWILLTRGLVNSYWG